MLKAILVTLILVLTVSCVTNLPPDGALKVGMQRDEAVKAMRQKPYSTTAISDLEILHFKVAPNGAPIGEPQPFVIYVRSGRVVAYGHAAAFQDERTRIDLNISGSQTNVNISHQ